METKTVYEKMQNSFDAFVGYYNQYLVATKALPTMKDLDGAPEDVKLFLQRLLHHDRYYAMSDCHSTWRAGRSVEEVLIRNINAFVHPDRRQEYVAALYNDDACRQVFSKYHPDIYLAYYVKGNKKVEWFIDQVETKGLPTAQREFEEFIHLTKRLHDEVGRLFEVVTYGEQNAFSHYIIAADTLDQDIYRAQKLWLAERNRSLHYNEITYPLEQQAYVNKFWGGWKLAIESYLGSPYHALVANESYRPLNIREEHGIRYLHLFRPGGKYYTLTVVLSVKKGQL